MALLSYTLHTSSAPVERLRASIIRKVVLFAQQLRERCSTAPEAIELEPGSVPECAITIERKYSVKFDVVVHNSFNIVYSFILLAF